MTLNTKNCSGPGPSANTTILLPLYYRDNTVFVPDITLCNLHGPGETLLVLKATLVIPLWYCSFALIVRVHNVMNRD